MQVMKLNYNLHGLLMGCLTRFELVLSEPQSDVLTANTINTVVTDGFEPPNSEES